MPYCTFCSCTKVWTKVSSISIPRASARPWNRPGHPVSAAAQACELETQQVLQFFQLFLSTPASVTLYSQGVNQWSFGTDKVNGIINCHLATGRIGKPGAGPFSMTGQPNAMGGREVGGLANQLVAHMDFADEDRQRVAKFWDAPKLASQPGLKAIDMMQAVEQGRIKALWIMATNPAVSLPDADRMRRVLRDCEFLVVSDCVSTTDTAACADVLLPAATWGEKNGTVTNSERRVSRQRAFMDPPGEARPDWWIITEVARRMGFADAFDYQAPVQILNEYGRLTGVDNGGRRDLDLTALAGLDETAYEQWQPQRWPLREGGGCEPLFADGRFFTDNGRARFVPVLPGRPANSVSQDYPLVLNTGRVRDQWHTMTRTGKAARLAQHRPEPTIQIHPEDAQRFDVIQNGLARLESAWGSLHARVEVTDSQRPGSLFAPMHWSDAFGRHVRLGALINPAVDPVSGQPEFKHTPVRIGPLKPRWQGFLLCRDAPKQVPELLYQVRVNSEVCRRYEIAGERDPDDWRAWAQAFMGAEGDWLWFHDDAAGRRRCAKLLNGSLQACLFVERDVSPPGRDWLNGLFGQSDLSSQDRTDLLAGRPRQSGEDRGPVVCSCFGVGLNTLKKGIEEQGLLTVEAIGKALRAGTNCGSCIPELRGLLPSK